MGRRPEFNTGIPYQIHILSTIHTCGTGIQDILNSKNEISTRTLNHYKSFSILTKLHPPIKYSLPHVVNRSYVHTQDITH